MLQLCVLGPVEVAVDGRRAPLASQRQRTLVAVLLAAGGEVVSADRLVEGLWGDRAPAGAHKTLQTHVSRLRRTLADIRPAGDGAVATATDGYRLDLAAVGLDAARFEDLLARARPRLRAEPESAIELLTEAQALWRGPAFGDLADHELVRAEARRLEQLRDAAATDRIDARLALGGHREVIGELEAAVRTDPLDERAHARLMLALYRSGHQAEALATYRRLQERLGDEVGIDPSGELRRLHERILRQDEALGPPATGPAPVPGADDRPPGDADRPEPVARAAADPDLIGRDEDVAAVTALMAPGALVTLIGAGGVGKTRLAQQVADVAATQLDDGATVCPLGAVRDPDSVAEAVIDALGAQHQGGRPAGETVVAALSTRRLLLVLDNCEHVLEAVSPLVESILQRCPGVAVLATSREPLHLSGERVWQVAPLPVPPTGAGPAEVAEAPAGALFLARATAADPAFALTSGNAEAVGELCRRLDGIPLAIELAATRVRAMSPADLLERIDQRFAVLTGGPHREEGRHRTLQAVVAWSYDLLGEPEARLFDRLSVFAGSFALAAAEQVCAGAPLDEAQVAGVLAELVDKSMVTVERVDDRVRYRLLETLRDYGATRLAERGEAERTRRAHARFHVAFVEALGPRVHDADEGVVLVEIDAAIDDLRVAHARLLADGDVDGALRLPVALQGYLGHRQRDEVITWTQRALALPGAPDHSAYPAALATAARGATRRGDLDLARRHAEDALARAGPDSHTALWALHALGGAALYEGRLDDVLAITERRLELATRLGEEFQIALARMMGVLAHRYRGDATTAAAHAVEFRRAADRSGNHALRAWALYVHGEALLDDDPDAAEPLLEQAIEVARGVSGRAAEGVAMVSLASSWGRRGEVDRALGLFRDVIVHWRRLGDWTHQLTTLRNLVELLARVGADEAAAVLHGAVTGVQPPSFGDEAERLATARVRLEERLGAEAVDAAAERGRGLAPAGMVDLALDTLDGRLEGRAAR